MSGFVVAGLNSDLKSDDHDSSGLKIGFFKKKQLEWRKHREQ
jgi:hypothetical protein